MARLFKPRIFKAQEGKRPSNESTPTELTIEDLSHDGRGVARHQGKTVFVGGALPGERVSVAHYRRHKRFSECETKRVIDASPERIEPSCPHYQHCGGCQLQHLSAVPQLAYKQKALLNLLKRQQGLEPAQLLPPIESPAYGYRARVRLGVDGAQQLSFREQGSDHLVAIRQCPVVDPLLAPLIPQLQAWLDTLPPKAGVTHIELLAALDANDQPASGVVIRHLKPLSVAAKQSLEQLAGLSACWFQAEKQGSLQNAQGETADPRLYLQLPAVSDADGTLSPVTLGFHPQDFTQVNPQVNRQMVAQALEWLNLTPADRVADLFCGIGNFTLPLAQQAGWVVGIEGAETMVGRGHENSARNGQPNCDFWALDLGSQALSSLLQTERINKVLLDPPRAGALFVCEQMATSAVERLVYVSCNPASFARDAAVLVDGGFVLAAMRVLDMFPQTIHMETMALFVRE